MKPAIIIGGALIGAATAIFLWPDKKKEKVIDIEPIKKPEPPPEKIPDEKAPDIEAIAPQPELEIKAA